MLSRTLEKTLRRALALANARQHEYATLEHLLMALSEVVELPETIPQICRDPDDDRIIACAVVGGAEVIVSGDDDLLVLDRVGEVVVLSPAQLLARIEGQERGESREH